MKDYKPSEIGGLSGGGGAGLPPGGGGGRLDINKLDSFELR